MTTSWHMFILIVLCGLVTLIIRVVPFLMISRIQLSETVIKWLSFIPITLFTALILDGIIEQQEGVAGYTLNIPFVLVTIPTVLLHFLRSLTTTILVGIVLIAGLRFFF